MPSDIEAAKIREIDHFTCQIFEKLASQFPVCTASDEFHFFPHIPPTQAHWARWDDFAPDRIAAVCEQMLAWRHQLETWMPSARSTARQIDLRLMQRVIGTLYEQLTQVACHRCQPTFYLTILGIGLAEAVAAGPQCLAQRLRGVPAFLEQAKRNLKQVPRIFNRLGLEMTERLLVWQRSLPDQGDGIAAVATALEGFAAHLARNPTREAFLPPIDVYERIVSDHIGCQNDMVGLEYELEREIAATVKRMQHYADQIQPGHAWQVVLAHLEPPDPSIPPGQHYQRAIDLLELHGIDRGLVPAALPRHCPVKVVAIPAYMRPVRSNAAFSATPGHPARGGTFYIADHTIGKTVPTDYRLLTAHETYPGHHLLDASRWNLARPVRRQIEFPLFYEGWASFSEELLFETGFFQGPIDHLLMAKRRFWRALRGRVDFNIHTRRHTLSQAADFLVAHGMAPRRAKAMVARYILKPGYQLSYAIGRRRFRRLYDQFTSADKVADFTRLVLSQGEIEFDQLETLMRQGGDR
jgi:hypothetical protein